MKRGLTLSILLAVIVLAALPAAAQFGQITLGPLSGTCHYSGTLGLDKTNGTVYVCGDDHVWASPGAVLALKEVAAPTGISAYTLCWADSSAHKFKCNQNAGSAWTVGFLEAANTWTATQSFATITTSGSTTTSDTNCINMVAATGAGQVKRCTVTETILAPTVGTTTDSVGNMLPADSIIVAVVARVTTAITGGTCSSWAVGDASTAGRFIAADSTLTLAETKASTGTAWTTGIASATTGMKQGAAAKARLTCGTGSAAAGAVEVTVIYDQAVAPTS